MALTSGALSALSSASKGDFDNDGDLDLFVANKGTSCDTCDQSAGTTPCQAEDYCLTRSTNALYVNLLDGGTSATFEKRTTGMDAVTDTGDSRCAIFADYNGDGNLDLFVCNTGDTGSSSTAARNFFYLNGGTASNYALTRVTTMARPGMAARPGMPTPVTDAYQSLAAAWGDYGTPHTP